MLHNQTTKLIHFEEKDYTITYPNMGQKMEIENLKIALTNGSYGDIARSAHISGDSFLDQVDSFIAVQVLMPDYGLKITDFLKLDELHSAKLVQLYQKQIRPFIKTISEEIAKLTNPKEEDATEKSDA